MTPLLITITAPTASGKTYLFERLMKHGFVQLVSTTTRPMRKGEVEGKDYYYLTKAKSVQMEKNNEFAEIVEFNGTRYGITKAEMESKFNSGKPAVAIMTPEGVHIYEHLVKEYDAEIIRVFVNVPEETRLARLNERSYNDIEELVGDDGEDSLNKKDVLKLLDIHTKRVVSVVTDERTWSKAAKYDLTVPGDDVKKAISLIQSAIEKK